MNIVIIGHGKAGSALVQALVEEKKHNITVVDSNPAKLDRVQNTMDVMVCCGNGASRETQEEANVKDADLVVAVTSRDEDNILCCAVAKELGAKRTMPRVRKKEYAESMNLLRDVMNVTMVLCPEKRCAEEITRVLSLPAATEVEIFGKERLELVSYKIPENSSLAGMYLRSIPQNLKTVILICAVQRNGQITIPDGDFQLQSGDKIHLVGTPKEVQKFFRSVRSLKARPKNILIAGGGLNAMYLGEMLIGAGYRVRIIESNHNRAQLVADALSKATVIEGDAADQGVLMDAGIEDVDGFVALTGMDEVNMLISLFARSVNPDAKLITKVNRPGYRAMADNLELDTVVSPLTSIKTSVIKLVRAQQNASGDSFCALYHLLDGQVEVLEFEVDSHIQGLTGIPIKNVKRKKDLLICAIVRNHEIIIPGGDTVIEKNDRVLIVSTNQHFAQLRDILKG